MAFELYFELRYLCKYKRTHFTIHICYTQEIFVQYVRKMFSDLVPDAVFLCPKLPSNVVLDTRTLTNAYQGCALRQTPELTM